MKFKITLIVLMLTISLMLGTAFAAKSGTITSLTSSPSVFVTGDQVSVSCILLPNEAISNSHVLFEIINSAGTTVKSYDTPLFNTQAGQTYTRTWDFTNDLPAGTYTLKATWLQGQGQGSVISTETTTVQSTAGHNGVITELTPVGAPYSTSGPIQFRIVTTNNGPTTIPASSTTATITYGSNNEFVSDVTYNVPSLAPGESYTYLWNTSNEGFPYNSFTSGISYTVGAVWTYPGGSDTKYTTFTSVPSPWFIVALAGILMAVAAIAHHKRWWLSFYLTGAVAFMSAIVAIFLITGYDVKIMGLEAQNIANIATFLGIPSSYLAPNAFLFPDPTGWSIFGIGFECSSIIEISVLIGLLLLYPGYDWKRKTKYAAIGIVVTYGANLIRMMSIVYIVNIFGKSSLYFAHAIVGKLIFFAFIIVLYWYLLTRPTLSIIKKNIKGGKFDY